ncbi:MAG: EAL domain-containing protein [Campylobacterota bacterium]|nr:EAL domain-containing protein [Campylobacterota bacterium]
MNYDQLYNYTKSLNIIYCEDDNDVLYELSEVFSRFFNLVHLASNGQEALKRCKEYYSQNGEYYDIVVTDISMPHMDGISLSKEIKKINPYQNILVISAYNDSDKITQLLNMGIDHFLHKPINLENTIDILHKLSKKVYNEKQLKQYHQNTIDSNILLEKKVNEKTKELYQKLYFDILTHLPKRNKLIEDIEGYKPKGLFLINVKEFKNINSVYGSKIGDKVLIELSNILQRLTEDMCKLYHLGGDEFAIINLNENIVVDECMLNAMDIITHINDKPITVKLENKTIDIYLNIIIGIAVNTKKLLAKADLALKYAYKKRLPYAKYSKDLNLMKRSKDDIKWTKKIKCALKDDNVVPYYQPIVTNNGLIKYECLIRIIDNNKVISPYFFLDISKKTGQYHLLTKVMIQKSFEFFENKEESFSINLTFEDIADNKLISFLLENITKYKVNGRLIVEILESESIDDFEIVKNFISVMKKLNVSISIDDFGSGYSNFIYLTQLEPDFIKIDGSIIKSIDTDKRSYIITQTIVNFAKQLGIKTIAEFVHSKDVYDKLNLIGVDAYQGYYFSEPVSDIKEYKK